MIKASVKFYGNDQDDYGMPKPYHSYLIVSSPWQTNDSGVASAIPLSSSTPTLNPPHKLVTSGGPEQAYDEMLKYLRLHPQNKGLQELIDKE